MQSPASADPDPGVVHYVDACPAKVRTRLLRLRRLLLDTADAIEGVGPITETLKWGEPAYLTRATRSGTTFRPRFPELEYEGNRAIVLPVSGALPTVALRECFVAALTDHRR